MEKVNAIMPISPIKNGVTKPYIINCSGEEYVVKFLQNPEGKKALVNEYVCAKIAIELELPLAHPNLINIDEIFIKDYGEDIKKHINAEIEPGVHFGTKKIQKVFPINTSAILGKARNTNVIPDVVLFDHLICNTDRGSNGGNLIFDYTNKKIVVIDHTHAFDIGPLWDEHQLNQRVGETIEPLDMSGYIYSKLVPYIDGYNPFSNILSNIRKLSFDTLTNIMNNIPQSWSVTDEEKKMLVKYLMDRIERVDEILYCIQPQLPRWKGGIS